MRLYVALPGEIRRSISLETGTFTCAEDYREERSVRSSKISQMEREVRPNCPAALQRRARSGGLLAEQYESESVPSSQAMDILGVPSIRLPVGNGPKHVD
jgi:hypothetical protein